MTNSLLFKKCPNCHYKWADREVFLSDPDVNIIGYQANFGNLKAGIFLFNHNINTCGTSFAVEVGEFTDMHKGSVFSEHLEYTGTCPDLCLHKSSIEPCYEKCECAYVRDILQKLRNWRKAKKG